MIKRFGNQPFVSFRMLAEASGVSENTIRKYVRLFQDKGLDEIDEDD